MLAVVVPFPIILLHCSGIFGPKTESMARTAIARVDIGSGRYSFAQLRAFWKRSMLSKRARKFPYPKPSSPQRWMTS